MSQISLWRNNSDWLDQTCWRKKSTIKNRTIEHHHFIPHIQISLLVPDFCFNWHFWFFWPDLSKKGFSDLKQKKWTPHIFYIILHIETRLVRNFSSNWQFWFFGRNLTKKLFPVKNRESEHRHGFLHIWISLCTKFQLKPIILCFWTNLPKKRYFQLKTEQVVQELLAFAFSVVNINSSVVFKHFEDLKDLILNILKEKLVMSCFLGSFHLKIV